MRISKARPGRRDRRGVHSAVRHEPLSRIGRSGPRRRLQQPSFCRELRRPAAHAAPGRLHGLAAPLLRPGMGRAVARTASFNVAATMAAGLGGIILARTIGPTVRGEYAAITAWFGVALML